MGIVKAIKSNELVGGNGDGYIYPVTSIKAIYDLNSKNLEDILREKDNTINNLENKTNVLQADISSVDTYVHEVENAQELLKSDLKDTKNSITEINATIQNIQPGSTFLGNITNENVRTSQSEINICAKIVNAEQCKNLPIQDIKNGDIIVPKKKGDYQIGDKNITIDEVSIIQKQGDDFKVISLGIPFIPIPTEQDKGKTLTVAENLTLYWG